MRVQNLYTAFAVILPVALGLGLVYLASVGRIEAYTALMATIAIAAAMAGAIAVRDAPERDPRGSQDKQGYQEDLE